MATPEYRVLSDSFYEPNWVLKGSIIRTTSSPGPHLQPLNTEAMARMEKWYKEEFDELDPKTRQPTGKKIYPHERYRIGVSERGEKHETTIVSGPPKDEPGSLSLAEAQQHQRPNTDQRPPPAAEYRTPPDAPVMAEAHAASAMPDAPAKLPEVLLPEASTPPGGTGNLSGAPVVASPDPVKEANASEPEKIDVVKVAPPSTTAKKIV